MIIPERFREGEGTRLEFKRMLPSEDRKVLKTIVAFANGSGGTVVFGVDDTTHEVRGIESDNMSRLLDSVTDMICSACEPLIVPEISLRTIGDKTIMQVDISPGVHLPYYIKKEGPEHGVYVRVGATTRVAEPEILRELRLAGERCSYDEIVERSSQPVTEAEVLQFELDVNARRVNNPLSLGYSQLAGRKLLKEQNGKYYPTVAFRLLTRGDLHFSGIQCALFKGVHKVHFLDRHEYKGTVQSQIDEACKFLLRNLRMGAKIKGLYREDVYELPPEALRETVTNAVMHRNYLSHAFIQISIYDDRVEIYSPGKLVAPQSLDKMMSGLSYLRNPLLADMFQQMRMAEHWGTGIQRVREACLENGVEPPAYTCDDMGVMVIYQRPDLNLERTPIRHHGTKNAYMGEYKELLAYIAGQGKVSVAEVMNFLSCSRSTAMRTISAMLSGNLIVKEGVHKNVRYVVAEHISKSLT